MTKNTVPRYGVGNESIIQLKLPYCTRVPSMIFSTFIVRTTSPLPQAFRCYVEELILHNSSAVISLILMKFSTFKMWLKGMTRDFLSQ